ncbi:Kinesin-4 [Drechslerella dactyloides]|uniref:Kinesin-like protein n=1 Tax=Drechslerella dactyloides TaxID=74499 RepID=A0AAD6J0V6_DREDA|nr:Kinesin-4 [Drechslerella dactyloides]
MATQTTTALPRPGIPRSSLQKSPTISSLPQPPSSIRKSPSSVTGIASAKSLKRPSSYASLRDESDKPNRLSTHSERNVGTGSARVFSLPPTSPLAPGGSGVAGSRRVSLLAPGSPIAPTPRKSSLNPKGRFPLNVSSIKKREEGGLGAGLNPDDTVPPPSPPLSRSSSQLGTHLETPIIDSSGGSRSPSAMGGEDDKDKGKGNVLVSIRVRPAGEAAKESSEWTVDSSKSLVRYNGKEGGDYYLDNVFAPRDSNVRVYESCCKRLVRRVMEGYHGTVFAYGMTGTGKTFSMQGTSENPGVIPLAVTDIFSFIRETPHREFLLRVSYLEIYNEKIHDLLSPTQNSGTGVFGQQVEEIKLREDSKRGVYATPLKEEIVQSPTQLLRVIARGDLARKTGSTQFNARSSRSHAVVQIVVESRERILGGAAGAPLDDARSRRETAIGGVRVSTLSLIDLAGSERAAETKERRQEGAHINKSLLTLGNVIARLSTKDAKDKDHLPYRDSKLTRLLQPALSGSSLISILCTMASSTDANHTESLNTLKFAARAKNNIVSHAKKAEEALVTDAGSKVLLERYRHEIAELRGQLELQAKVQMESQEQEAQRHEEQMIEIQLARTALKERIDHLNRLILSSKSSGVNTTTGTAHNSALLSARSSAYSTVTGPGPQAVPRTFSQSTFASIGPPPEFLPSDPGSDDSAGEYGDGSATLAAQVKALQADNADKSRYIATLEKRLLQARRASQSRTSIGIANSPRISGVGDEGSWASIIREKDAEIANLRAQLDDKERMVSALRSSARKRELADLKVLKVRTKSIDDLLSSKRRASTNPLSPPLKTGSDDITGNPVAEDEEELLLVKPLNISVRRTPVRSSSVTQAQTSVAKKKASVMSLPDSMPEPILA